MKWLSSSDQIFSHQDDEERKEYFIFYYTGKTTVKKDVLEVILCVLRRLGGKTQCLYYNIKPPQQEALLNNLYVNYIILIK